MNSVPVGSLLVRQAEVTSALSRQTLVLGSGVGGKQKISCSREFSASLLSGRRAHKHMCMYTHTHTCVQKPH